MSKIPRGIRNCNPGNIRRNNTKWQGLREVQTDHSFFQFESMEWGYRAMLRTLQNYQRIHGLKTLSEMIYRQAPPFENNTEQYIRVVSNRAKIRPNVPIDVNNKSLMSRLVEAMCFMENSVVGDFNEIERGWELL